MSILPCDSNSFGRLYFSISNLQLPFLTSYLLKYIDATSMGKGKRLAMEPYRFFPNSFLNAVLIVFRQFDRRRQWHPIPVFLPGEPHGQRSLEVCSPQDHKESDMTEATQHMGTHGVYRRLANSRGSLGWYIVVSSRSSVSHSVVSDSL